MLKPRGAQPHRVAHPLALRHVQAALWISLAVLALGAPLVHAQDPPSTIAPAYSVSFPLVDLTLEAAPDRLTEGAEAVAMYVVRNPANSTINLTATFDEVVSAGMQRSIIGSVEPARFTLGPNGTERLTIRILGFDAREATTQHVGVVQIWMDGMMVRDAALGLALAEASPPPDDSSLTPFGEWLRDHPLVVGGVALAGTATVGLVALRRRESARYLALLALAPLYTRLARANVLDQQRRDEVFRIIEAEPGINYTALKRRTNLGAGVLVHHLRTLERHQLITSRRDGVLRRFAPVRVAFPELPPAPLTGMQEKVLALLREAPLTQRQIAATLGLTPQGANHHVKALQRRGLLELRYVDGEYRCFALAPALT